MKKKLLTLLAMAAIGAALVTGCGGSDNTVAPEDSIAATIQVEDESLPPLDAELQQLYADAYKIYYQTNLAKFDYDAEDIFEKDGFEYYRITDSRFKTYDDFRA